MGTVTSSTSTGSSSKSCIESGLTTAASAEWTTMQSAPQCRGSSQLLHQQSVPQCRAYYNAEGATLLHEQSVLQCRVYHNAEGATLLHQQSVTTSTSSASASSRVRHFAPLLLQQGVPPLQQRKPLHHSLSARFASLRGRLLVGLRAHKGR